MLTSRSCVARSWLCEHLVSVGADLSECDLRSKHMAVPAATGRELMERMGVPPPAWRQLQTGPLPLSLANSASESLATATSAALAVAVGEAAAAAPPGAPAGLTAAAQPPTGGASGLASGSGVLERLSGGGLGVVSRGSLAALLGEGSAELERALAQVRSGSAVV
jgi:hypothetical protein